MVKPPPEGEVPGWVTDWVSRVSRVQADCKPSISICDGEHCEP